MSLKDTFCSSPWFHAKLSANGQLDYCRWATELDQDQYPENNIRNIDPTEYFQKTMASIRQDFLDGKAVEKCHQCYAVDKHDKVSGRQRQLLKVGVTVDRFEKTLQSSPIRNELAYSSDNHGLTNYLPIDWQVDLGNHCNGACIYCGPQWSSKLAAEFKKIGFIDKIPDKPWTELPELIDRFVDTLKKTKHLAYIHFLGGETVITPAFKTILQALIDNGISKTVSIGLTTNLTVWNQEIIDMLCEFKEVNLGMSVECFDPVNDYVRYPSKSDEVFKITQQWVDVGRQNNWLLQFRMTPSCLTISKLLTVYEYAYDNEISVESCNFMTNPSFLAPNVLPTELREPIIKQLEQWVDSKQIADSDNKIINTRHQAFAQQQIVQDAQSYINYLKNEPVINETGKMIDFLKKLEQSRGNKITDYLPEYDDYLRTAGY